MGSPTVDTPDGVAGVVNAQALVATVPAGTATVTIGVPLNAETFAVYSSTGGVGQVFCRGTTSNMMYPGVAVAGSASIQALPTYYFDVAGAVDGEVLIGWTGSAPALESWYVYCDSGIHVVADPNVSALISNAGEVDTGGGIQALGTDSTKSRILRTDQRGVLYTIPTVPDTATGDHPPVELSFTNAFAAANGAVMIAAPGAGRRIRVFSASVGSTTAGDIVFIYDAGTNVGLLYGSGSPTAITFPGQGVPITTNAALSVGSTAGTIYATAVYTIEAV